MEAICGKTIREIADNYAIPPTQVSQWKQQHLDGASELFEPIGKLQMNLDWLIKHLRFSDANELRKAVDHDTSSPS